MIIPVSHERETLLRYPMGTWGLIIVCLAAHLLLTSPYDELALYQDAFGYWLEHAYLDPGPQLGADEIFADPELQVLAEAWNTMEQPDLARISSEQGELPVPFARLRAVGAAEIRVGEKRPYWLLDLVVPSSANTPEDLVTLRCERRYFDLPSLVPGGVASAPAIVAIVGRLLGGSGAALIPEDLEPSAAQPFARFLSVGEYERALGRHLAARA